MITHYKIYAFCSLTDRPTDKIFTEKMLRDKKKICTEKRLISLLTAEKIAFPPKPVTRTYRHTDRLTDISSYRGASLLKTTRLDYSQFRFSEKLSII